MTRQKQLISAILLTLMVALTSCKAPIKPIAPNDRAGTPKVTKNRFLKQYPDEFFSIQCGLKDQAGNMWFGSTADGIYYYDGSTFTNFTRKDGLSYDDILCCLEDKSGTIWFGTRKGLIRYIPTGARPEKSHFTSISIPANTISRATEGQHQDTLFSMDDFVWSIMQDKSGQLWFATDKGVFLYNPATNNHAEKPVFTPFLEISGLINNSNLHLKDVSKIFQDLHGEIWFTSDHIQGEGICRYAENKLINFKPDALTRFRTISDSNGDLLFLSASHSIYAFDGLRFYHFTDDIGLNNYNIISLLYDSLDNLWLGMYDEKPTSGSGVWCYRNEKLTHFTTEDGLSHNNVFCIVEGRDGDIWFGTSNTGLCRFDGKTVTNYTE